MGSYHTGTVLENGKTLTELCRHLEGIPDGPTVQLTGMLMARSLLAMFRTRSPKYSSLHHHGIGWVRMVLAWLSPEEQNNA